MRKFTLMVVILLFIGLQGVFAQRTITGTVTSVDDGSGIPGVTVVAVGVPGIGTITDLNGKYNLSIPANVKQLQFSFVGMKTMEMEIGASSVVDVKMATETVKLGEVVVTAMGIKRETKALGYSVQELGGEKLERVQNSNVLNSLNGKIAGVQITNSSGASGSSAYINIRGQSSIGGDNQPLIVVDGIPIDNSQNYSGNPDQGTNNLTEGVAYSNRSIDINPDDIENVTVLKGGAATALYGLRAANGVIVITTKKGNTTKGEGVSNVSYSTSVSFDVVSQMPELQQKYSQGLNGVWKGPETANRNSWGQNIDSLRYTNTGLSASQDVNGDGIYDWDKNGILVDKNDPRVNANSKTVTPYKNIDNFFNTGVTYNNAISLGGGTNLSNYYLSLSNLTQNGIVPNNTFDKTTVKISGETKITPKFTVSGSANYINSGGDRIQQGSNLSGLMLGMLRTPITFDIGNGYGGDAVTHPDAYMFADGQQRSYRGYGIYDNPYWTVNQNKFTDDVNRLIGNISAIYVPTDWFTVTYRLGGDYYSDRRKAYFAIGSSAYTEGMVFEDQHFNKDINSDLILNVKRNLTKNIKLDFSLGNNIFQTYHQQVYVEGDQLSQPNFYHISNASSVVARENQDKKRTAAFYGELGLSYQSLIFLNFTGRNEWSTTLPKDKNSFFFPSASLGFVFTELDALKPTSNFLSFGKLRASYAVIANDAFTYGTLNYYAPGFYNDGWTSGISFPFNSTTGYMTDDGLGNLNLKPEKMKSFEVGTDLRFYKNRIMLDLAYYSNRNEDLILWVPLAGSSGYTSTLMNAATMTNKGLEISLSLVPFKQKDWDWTITLNFSMNKNEVVKLAEGVENVGLGGFTGAEIRAVVGKPYGSIYGTQWLTDKNGNLVINDDTNDANYGRPIMSLEEGFLGSVQPKWTAGLNNAFRYKNIGLSFLIDVKEGGKMWNGTKGIMNALGTSKETENRGATTTFSGVKGHLDANGDLVSTGQANNIETTLDQSWYNGLGGGFGGPSSQVVEDANWIRLREVTISYTLGDKFIKSHLKFIKGLDIYFTGKNLWLSTPYSGIDPETNLYGASNAQGIDYFNMPGTKTYTFGLRLKL
jgi:TonB-linked SusC/RagA family outer membrane protein